ncbi:MAG: TonB-dependent receptor plug domain-containing protein [Bacteroidota bacterium]|nr:TonB-dependent receptor plug domain-containing protein [Bacteroidota bacterium]MDP4212749.1 TonB-dependent receptor plug domain-containing protein [Bacteroidota bacterium]MDP4249346.1 TonB-dependent receptor plug domain-containing protein [Bacteroidota bacterium]
MKSFVILFLFSGFTRFCFSQSLRAGSIATPSIADTVPARFRTLFLKPVEVIAIRAGDKAPFTKTNFSAAEIAKNNTGQDIPFILNQTVSVVSNSDAGNGVGYTGISIRGTDATRINMTLNGLPYNDAESQSIYFVDLPDFASSVSSIQIQRGVGTSSNGAGAFGASINFSTNEFKGDPYAEFNNSFGSFNTWKNTLKAGTGLIGGHFTVDMRLSRISSDGYIDRAASDLKSAYFSVAWLGKKTSARFNLITGAEKTYQAWNGVPEAKLYGNPPTLDEHYQNNSGYSGALYNTVQDSLNLYQSNPRTYNYFTYKNQTDNYLQNHYQGFLNHQFSNFITANMAAFLTRGKGYYEEYKNNAAYADYGLPNFQAGDSSYSNTDLIRQKWLDNFFYGGIFSFQYKKQHTELTLGGGWDRYDGKHYGNIIWSAQGGIPDDYRYYDDPARKTDFNGYAKWQQELGGYFSSFADLQFHQITYVINGFDDNPLLPIHISNRYQFLNPKAGFSYNEGPWQGYVSYALARHEPNRDDFEAGLTQQPKPETLHDFEIGLNKRRLDYNWGITGYYMLYHDQLVLTGKINDVGSYTRTNTPRSYRLGLEFQGAWKPVTWFQASGNLTLSQNKVLNYTEYIDDYDNGGQKAFTYKKADIALSPGIIAAASLSFYPTRQVEISLPGKYVGTSYLDNSQSNQKKISDYYVQQFRVIYSPKIKAVREMNLAFQINNLLNKRYEANGYTYGYYTGGKLVNENFLFPQAGRNLMMSVNIGI